MIDFIVIVILFILNRKILDIDFKECLISEILYIGFKIIILTIIEYK